MNMAPVLKYPGSKYTLADWIIEHMPRHETYLEPFFGSGAIFFNKKPCPVETINDMDHNVVNLFKVIRERPEELATLVEWTPWSRKEYQDLLTSASAEDYFVRTGDELEDARRLLVRMWMGHGSKTSDRTGWRHNVQAKVGNCCARVWHKLPDRIVAAAKRLKDAQIECRPALELIERYRYQKVLIYADPPYMFETRRDKRQYKHEMPDADHIDLLEVLDKHPGPVLLSGYACPLYDDRLKHWERRTAKALAEGGRERQEVLWINQVAAKEVCGLRLF